MTAKAAGGQDWLYILCERHAELLDGSLDEGAASSAAVTGVIAREPPERVALSLSRDGAGNATRCRPDSWAADPLCASLSLDGSIISPLSHCRAAGASRRLKRRRFGSARRAQLLCE